jgi:hypothetical protein
MRHPEVLLAPLLMVFDYYLTLLGAYLPERAYRRHFKTAASSLFFRRATSSLARLRRF